MAKNDNKLNKTVIAALKKINETGRVTREVGEPLVQMGLIEVNPSDIDDNGAALARLTQKELTVWVLLIRIRMLMLRLRRLSLLLLIMRSFQKASVVLVAPLVCLSIRLLKMNVGQSFFVGNNEVDGGDAVKKLTSTVSNMNNKYRTEVPGQTETKTRTKRGEGNKAVKDENGNPVKGDCYRPRFILRIVSLAFVLSMAVRLTAVGLPRLTVRLSLA